LFETVDEGAKKAFEELTENAQVAFGFTKYGFLHGWSLIFILLAVAIVIALIINNKDD
jgi:hypothetical protein